MAKRIPEEQLLGLWHELQKLPARSQIRRDKVKAFSSYFGISENYAYRQLKEFKPFESNRSDLGTSRKFKDDVLIKYCKVISALKLKTSNKKDNHLSTSECIRILEDHGVSIDGELVKAPAGLLKRSSVDKHLKRLNLDYDTVKYIEPIVSRFEAQYSNECWQFDFTPSNLKRLNNSDTGLFLANILDDKSGIVFSKYIETDGEGAMSTLLFLFDAMKDKDSCKTNYLQGIPKYIYTDNGAFAKSKIFKRALQSLGITLLTHMPKNSDGRRTTARSKGKIERFNQTIKNSLESKYFLHSPTSIEEANEWLIDYISYYNALNHRSIKQPKLKVWKDNLEHNKIREMCSWEQFCKIVRKPETRKVKQDSTLVMDNISYQLDAVMANTKVTILYGLLDKQIYVESKGKWLGPYYPSQNIISFQDFDKKPKTHVEKQADEVAEIAKNMSISKDIMYFDSGHEHEKILKEPFKEDRFIFDNKIEAKVFISSYIGSPLSQMSSDYKAFINQTLLETLDRELIIRELENYTALELYINKEKA